MTTLTPDQIRQYQTSGFVVIPSRLAPGEIESIAAETLAQLAGEELRRKEDAAYQELTRYRRWVFAPHMRSGLIRGFVLSGVFQAIARALIGDEAELQFTSTIAKSPGRNKSIDWHQDSAYEMDGHSPRLLCWTSLTASGPENGGLAVIPGSHLGGAVAHEKSALYHRDVRTVGVDPDTAHPLILEAGDIVVIHRHLVHGSPENRTPRDRIALLSSYQKPKAVYTDTEAKTRLPLIRGGAPAPV